MIASLQTASLLIVVGAGGVGKTTVAAALGLGLAREGRDTLVMTFDPSLRLKDTLGVGDAARDRDVTVAIDTPGRLAVSLLDAKATFDRLVRRYAPDAGVADRILANRFYAHLSGSLAGVLEYMAVERLFEVAAEGRFDGIVLDTPPTRQALDFLEAPSRIIGFLDSGALRLALRPWFDDRGHLRVTRGFGAFGRGVEAWFDRVVGLGLLRDMAEFFLAFAPLYEGFRERAHAVDRLLRAPGTVFVVVTRPEEDRIPETLFFARRLAERGHAVGPVVVNMRHPLVAPDVQADGAPAAAVDLMRWLGARDARGIDAYRARLASHPLIELPLFPDEPSELGALSRLSETLTAEIRGRG
jgi:anion-transporting  ArsA/GET3 family ATPase